jgi:hypothetical protein
LNLRPPRPERGALPDWGRHRFFSRVSGQESDQPILAPGAQSALTRPDRGFEAHRTLIVPQGLSACVTTSQWHWPLRAHCHRVLRCGIIVPRRRKNYRFSARVDRPDKAVCRLLTNSSYFVLACDGGHHARPILTFRGHRGTCDYRCICSNPSYQQLCFLGSDFRLRRARDRKCDLLPLRLVSVFHSRPRLHAG